ncbi:MAG: G8 domain-containing protein, partial [Burkholderiales bacterium]
MAVQDGLWSNPSTWLDGKVPTQDATVLIPANVEVSIDAIVPARLKWVRIDGTLSLAPEEDTRLQVVSIVVAPGGHLQVGTEAHRVSASHSAEVIFADRGERDTVYDPFDLSGRLICHGELTVYGAEKSGYEISQDPVTSGTQEIRLKSRAIGWQIGDRLVIPGTRLDTVEDEERTIAAIATDGSRIVLDKPLTYDHTTPAGIPMPVGNLSRNVIFRSETTDVLGRRGHMMVMHAQTGTHIEGAALYGLGRTDAKTAHTMPILDADGKLVEGSDGNTIGRYALHFHMRSGASRATPPHIVKGSVIVDSPKLGLVNHGGNVVAEDNVTYRIAGSHFFTENGSEIGAFRRNLAIRSNGSTDLVQGRIGNFDHGYRGHGFWMGVASYSGIEIWYHQVFTKHDAISHVSDSKFWRLRDRGVFIGYSRNIDIRNVTAIAGSDEPHGYGFVRNVLTANIVYDGLHVEGFAVGVDMSRNVIRCSNGRRVVSQTWLSREHRSGFAVFHFCDFRSVSSTLIPSFTGMPPTGTKSSAARNAAAVGSVTWDGRLRWWTRWPLSHPMPSAWRSTAQIWPTGRVVGPSSRA